jgi:glyoxylase-like metal-dependent hydrolase (beta-lactamase superfamily II)
VDQVVWGIVRWTVLTIGHLSRNRFWGEDQSQARRPPLCTSALMRAGDAVILVDPPLPPAEMAGLLDRRTGLAPGAVTHVFLTHFHGDHRAGLEAFPGIPWLMPEVEVGHWDALLAGDAAERRLLERITPVPAEGGAVAPGVRTMHLPGHTPGLAGLVFEDGDGFRVVLAADAAMTRDFFEARAGYFNSDDFDAAAQSIDRLRAEAEVILPGHDNLFWNRRATGEAP